MQIAKELSQLPSGLACVTTIGIFDGVHRGHQELINQVVSLAKKYQVQAWAVTFDPHPAVLHAPEKYIRLITPISDRLNALAAMGLDGVLVAPYTWDLAALTPREFVSQYFVSALGVKAVVVGSDVRFGKDNAGDLTTLRELGQEFGFEVVVVDEQQHDDGRRFSSTWVRQALATGQVSEVAEVLGHYHRVRGQVVHGAKRGRELGFPTANLDAETLGEVPADGVYAGWLIRAIPGTNAEERLAVAISVGTNPQFEGQKRTIEAHVLGRSDLNLYGQEVAVDFVKRIRPMWKFDSLEQLLAQMDEDLRQTACTLGVPVAERIDPKAVTAK
ncbi:riboflavin biosynthesis protein RibF [Boudabousia tangfeifanii]|uniref:Riboflavin biosynthesis protein n=1 Tax=Boudabousia tangfeifanii TaxID=1912795 RepID=A0A1D9MKN5_9ACTO|nr:bifunctional riboflavin kinase/FAD synthetase [Boudabousia tangfeifanii]AOZ72877.1 riboflavin biosynthesis protein RibF [Boudabousia tangfeifanii]